MKGFISYSHVDSSVVDPLVNDLNAKGVDLFFDKWDIQPGDSLIQKIFKSGLGQADLFLVVLSKNSTTSAWVREELDAATIRKIEGLTRIVPIVIDDCDIPVSLRALKWIDLRTDHVQGIREIVNLAHGHPTRPPLGQPPTRVQLLKSSIGGLSPAATKIGASSVLEQDYDEYRLLAATGEVLSREFDLSPEEVNDAVDELQRLGLVEPLRTAGTAPYEFYQISPTYMAYIHFRSLLPYDPFEDIKIVIAFVAAKKFADGNMLRSVLDSPGRVNRAVDYLQDNGLAQVVRFIGTAPFSFGQITATSATRRAANTM